MKRIKIIIALLVLIYVGVCAGCGLKTDPVLSKAVTGQMSSMIS